MGKVLNVKLTELWDLYQENEWKNALNTYDGVTSVKRNSDLETEMDNTHDLLSRFKNMNSNELYVFLFLSSLFGSILPPIARRL